MQTTNINICAMKQEQMADIQQKIVISDYPDSGKIEPDYVKMLYRC